MRLWTLFALAGCDGVFNLDPVPVRRDAVTDTVTGDGHELDAQPGCTLETFSDGIDGVLTRWRRTMESPGVAISVEAGELVPKVEAGRVGYALLDTIQRFNMTGATATVTTNTVLGGSMSETFFAIVADQTNYYFFDVDGGYITMRVRELGVDRQEKGLSYDEVGHRFWRFRHDVPGGVVQFFTSADGTANSWVKQHEVTLLVPVGSMIVELGAGAYNVAAESVREARFDNFEYCPP